MRTVVVRSPTQEDDRIVAELDAAYFDGWYTDLAHSPAQQRIQQDALGLPPRLQSSSLLTWDGLDEVIDLLDVGPGDTLLDVACGRGGYGLEAAARTGAALIGVDFSAVAIAQAERNVPTFELAASARFQVGDLVDTGLADRCADAVLCVDAIQFATPFLSAAREFRRVLRADGRAVLTCWQPVDRATEAIPARLRELDPARDLTAAGFTDVVVDDRPDWHDAERAMWDAAIAVGPSADPAITSMQSEATRVLAQFAAIRRVLITATAPS